MLLLVIVPFVTVTVGGTLSCIVTCPSAPASVPLNNLAYIISPRFRFSIVTLCCPTGPVSHVPVLLLFCHCICKLVVVFKSILAVSVR